MANKIIFGADLIDVLENKYNMSQLANVPTKYKNGVTTIDFIYGKEKDIDDLKYNKPYVEFSIDDETDGFISGTMYLNGGVEGIQFDSWEDLKYFMKNAKWTESRKSMKENRFDDIIRDVENLLFDDRVLKSIEGYEKEYTELAYMLAERLDPNDYAMSTEDDLAREIENMLVRGKIKIKESKKFTRKSLKEGIDVKIVYADDTPSEYIDDVTRSDILDIIEESPEVYKIFDVSGSKKKLVWSDEYGFERAYESKKFVRKSIKESVKPEIQRMVNRIIDDLIGEYSSKEWDSLSDDEKFDIVENKYDFYYEFYFNKKNPKDLLEVRDLVIENMNHPFNVVFESKKSMKKSLKESKDSDFFNGIAKEYHFSKDEKTRYKDKTHISVIGVLFDRINDAIKTYGRNSDEEYNALSDCWSVITSAKQNGWNVDYEEDKWNKIAGLPNYH